MLTYTLPWRCGWMVSVRYRLDVKRKSSTPRIVTDPAARVTMTRKVTGTTSNSKVKIKDLLLVQRSTLHYWKCDDDSRSVYMTDTLFLRWLVKLAVFPIETLGYIIDPLL